MFTTTAGHTTEAEQQGAAYAARMKAATDEAQMKQPSIHKPKQGSKKAKSTAPPTPEPASPALAAKGKPRTKKAANAGGVQP